MTGPQAPTRPGATAGGVAALAVWSTSVAVVRSVSASLGTLTAGALAMGAGGLVALALAWARGRPPKAMLALPRKYLLLCGGLFVGYEVCMYGALGWAANDSIALLAGLANYLWPVLTVVLAVPILHRRARWWMALGCLVAVAGISAAVLDHPQFQWGQLRQAGPSAIGPLALAVAGALLWGLYCNLVRRCGQPEMGAVPLFLLGAAATLGLMRLLHTETTTWSARSAAELCFIAVAQSALAYALWEYGMRGGNHLLLGLLSYFLPIAATAVAATYLRVVPGGGLIVGCVLVTAGALICKSALAER